MPNFPPIPDYLIPLLGIIVPVIAGWLNDDNLPKWFNAIVAGIIVLFLAFICAILTHSLSGDSALNFMAVAAFFYFLLAGPLAPLHKWLVLSMPSPFKAFASAK